MLGQLVEWQVRSHGEHVQLRVGFLSKVSRGSRSQLGLLGTVGSQQDRGRKDAHRVPLLAQGVYPVHVSCQPTTPGASEEGLFSGVCGRVILRSSPSPGPTPRSIRDWGLLSEGIM